MIILDCQFCGAEFEAERSSRKFCSNSCKTQANTQRRENEFNQYRNEQRQAGIEMEAELQRKWGEQLSAEKAEQDRLLAEQRKQREEQRRAKEKEKLKKDREKKRQASEYKSKLKAVGLMAVLGIGYQLIKAIAKPEAPNAETPHMQNNQTGEKSNSKSELKE